MFTCNLFKDSCVVFLLVLASAEASSPSQSLGFEKSSAIDAAVSPSQLIDGLSLSMRWWSVVFRVFDRVILWSLVLLEWV
jgi:hypothetical protein